MYIHKRWNLIRKRSLLLFFFFFSYLYVVGKRDIGVEQKSLGGVRGLTMNSCSSFATSGVFE